MKTDFQQGDAVHVYDTPGNRSRAEAGETIPARPATVARQMPNEPDERDTYEVTFSDAGEPRSAFVDVHYLLPESGNA